MFGLSNFGRRLLESVVGVFAILGFLYVPLGRHTGFEHAKAVFSTPAAAAAIEDVTTTALGLRQRVMDYVSGRIDTGTGGGANAEVGPKDHAAGRAPRPVPPPLK